RRDSRPDPLGGPVRLGQPPDAHPGRSHRPGGEGVMASVKGMKVGIAGAGAIAYGAAAFLEHAGHKATLWSPSGKRTQRLAAGEPLVASGAVEGRFHPGVAANAAELAAGAEAILVALPGYGHKAVFDALAPHLRDGQVIII